MTFPAAILVLGASGIIAQLLLLRELFITFLSNELSLGIVLANWLVMEAAGSFIGGRLIERARHRRTHFVWVTLFFSVTLPLAVYMARIWKTVIGAVPGEGMGLHQIFLASFVILIPVCLSHGALFSFACRIYADITGRRAPGIGRVYFMETLGTLAGGLVFTFVLIIFFTSFETALILSAVNAAVCILVLRDSGTGPSAAPSGTKRNPAFERVMAALSAMVLIVSALFLVGPPADRLHWSSIRRQWPGQEVVHYENSVYGNTAVIAREGEYTFLSNGTPAITVPTPDIAFTEEFTHLPVLLQGRPKDVLVISGGAGGVIGELLKYPVERIDYIELDPLILRLVREYHTPLTEAELDDPRVKVHYRDGRLFLKETTRRYDLMFLGLSDPMDLQINRFFTRQFFSLAIQRLKSGGLLAFTLPGSTTYLGSELRDLNACIINTLAEVFPRTRIIPGDGFNILLAATWHDLTSCDADCVARRLEASKAAVRFISTPYIKYRLDPRWIEWFNDSLAGATEKINEDFKPLGVYYSISHWNARFAPRLQWTYNRAGRVSLGFLALLTVLAALLLLVLVPRSREPVRAAVLPAMLSTGFAGMILELALMFTFQALYGVVFYWVGLLVTAFMAGTATGSFGMTRLMERMRGAAAWLVAVETSLVLFSLFLPAVFYGLESQLYGAGLSLLVQMLFITLSFVAGLLIGCEFPLAGKLYLGSSSDVGGAAGLLYGVDLLGGWIGGMAGGVVLLPILGLLETCLLLGLMKLLSMLLVLTASGRE